MNKKIVTLLMLGIACCLGLSGCGKQEKKEPVVEAVQIESSDEEIYNTIEDNTETDPTQVEEEEIIEKISFEDYGIEVSDFSEEKELDVNISIYDFEDNLIVKTPAKYSLKNYKVSENFEEHTLPEEGYVWVSFSRCYRILDEEAINILKQTNGYAYIPSNIEYYYDPKAWDDSAVADEEEGFRLHTIVWENEKHIIKNIGYALICSQIDDDNCLYEDEYFAVPVGFDGIVIGTRSSEVEWSSDKYIYDVYEPDLIKMFRLPKAELNIE